MKNCWIVTMLVLLAGTPVRGADLFNKSYAVVIGISSYQNADKWKSLNNAENDAKAMGDFLREQGFKVQSFVSHQATKANIISYMEDTLTRELTQNDRFIFYFSGHGDTRSVGGRDRGYLIPYDGDTEKSSTWIAMEQLKDLADNLGTARHQLFILDSCFGGQFATKSSMSSIPENVPEYIVEVTTHRARQYLTAGDANEETPASSNLDGYKQYSYYTAYLLKALREGAADTYRDGFITASELDSYLGPAARSKDNTPRGGSFFGHEQGNFVFRSPKSAQIVSSPNMLPGPTKGNDNREVERLRAEVERLRAAKPKTEPQSPSSPAAVKKILTKEEQDRLESEYQREQHANSSSAIKMLSKAEQAQVDYEWEKTKGAGASSTIEGFLRMYPVGTHVPAVQKRLSELRALGR